MDIRLSSSQGIDPRYKNTNIHGSYVLYAYRSSYPDWVGTQNTKQLVKQNWTTPIYIKQRMYYDLTSVFKSLSYRNQRAGSMESIEQIYIVLFLILPRPLTRKKHCCLDRHLNYTFVYTPQKASPTALDRLSFRKHARFDSCLLVPWRCWYGTGGMFEHFWEEM